jgi:type IV pilus assembly protein PilY1
MILFGTGKYLEGGDDTGPFTATNSFYGIWDRLNNTTVARGELMVQQVLNTSSTNLTGAFLANGNNFRILSSFVPNYTAANRLNEDTSVVPTVVKWGDPNVDPFFEDSVQTTPPQSGWVVDLPNSADSGPPNLPAAGTGEKVVFDPIISTGKVVFPTLLPSGVACEAGGTSFIMDMEPLNGGRLLFSPFDVNNDTNFTNADRVTFGSGSTARSVFVSGLQSTIGIVPQPTVIQASSGKEIKVLSGSSGGLMSVLENAPGSSGSSGSRGGRRVNWREVLSD